MGKTIVQTVRFDATPKELFAIYVDSKKHSAATGGAAKISAKAGTKFTVWDESYFGRTLHVVKDAMIVQTWRGADWKKSDPDSILILTFEKDGKGALLTMVHANVPDRLRDDLDEGWRDFYWTPWREYLAAR